MVTGKTDMVGTCTKGFAESAVAGQTILLNNFEEAGGNDIIDKGFSISGESATHFIMVVGDAILDTGNDAIIGVGIVALGVDSFLYPRLEIDIQFVI